MISLLLTLGLAHAGEYRKFDLVDGRSFRALAVGNADTGLEVALPYGTMLIPYASVQNITNIDAAEFRAAEPLRVLLLPVWGGDGNDAAAAELALRTELDVMSAGSENGGLRVAASEDPAFPADVAAALRGCTGDVAQRTACARATVNATLADVALLPSLEGEPGDRSLTLHAIWIGHPTVDPADGRLPFPSGASARRSTASDVIHDALGLHRLPLSAPVMVTTAPAVQPATAPTSTAPTSTAPTSTAPTSTVPPATNPATAVATTPPTTPPPSQVAPKAPRSVSPALAFVPIPGFPAWVAGDNAHGALAALVVAPSTVGIAYLAGASSSHKTEFIALSVLGYYSLCVAANQAWMPTITPTEGGATIGAAGRF